MKFIRLSHRNPTRCDSIAEAISRPGFGSQFTDHMVVIEYDANNGGWHSAIVGPRQPLLIDPAAGVLHYAQEIFEGLKAYRHSDGGIALFRPLENARRFNASARRLAMPEIPEKLFLKSLQELVEVDQNWVPEATNGTLYLRPFMIATEAFLGVRPATKYKFVVIASPSGNYFRSGESTINIWVSDYTRAAPGGTGEAKCGGNYAASLVPTGEAFSHGYDQVMFLDAVERKWIEELGGMNLFFVFADGRILTPPLGGTILAGITRDSLISLLRDMGHEVIEDRYSIANLKRDVRSNALVEVIACGTAATVTSVGRVKSSKYNIVIGSESAGPVAKAARDKLIAIQTGEASDSFGWVMRIGNAS